MGGDFNLMRNMAQRLFKGKRLIYLSIILLALVLLNLGLSVIMRWQKQETCESIADVWKDVGHLVSQKYDTDKIIPSTRKSGWQLLAASRGGYILLHWHLSNMQSFGNHIRAVTDNHGFFTYFGKFVTINGICSYKHN